MNVLVCPRKKGVRVIWARLRRPVPSELHRNFLESLSQDIIVAISQRTPDKTCLYSQSHDTANIAEATSSTASLYD